MTDDKKEGGIIGQVTVGILVALIAGSTSPWWVDKLFSQSSSLSDETHPLLGLWKIEKWHEESGDENSGTLLIDRKTSDKIFHGTFKVISGDDSRLVMEEVTIRIIDDTIFMEGRVINDEQWSDDQITFEYKGNQLIGKKY
jgi:hypothetical protein